MSQKKDGLTVEQALGLAATDHDQLLERLHRVTPDTGWIPLPPSRWPSKHVERAGRRRWEWRCTGGGQVLASGWALTERWAWHRAHAAANRIHDERMEAER